ncbi:ATP-dependent helicase [Labedella endophytica]|uniref:DNA 3'-5' helicase n=1 Tax=Labedella endophytica TaxID=1523160 RepID=A0A433JRA6_9MICO|nr:ATP-dependent helicase [Labedella endophytica]RUQ99264.1 ATP-dependent helicase [Labedella endophytica]
MTPDLLDGLDEQQRTAAEALRGPVCILAGAGTGKTRAITHRIAHGVATGTYAPNRVLALTFTARAAAELRSRLRALGAGGVSARTFHAAALSQLGYFWPQIVGGTLPQIVPSKATLLAHAADRARIKVDTATLRDIASEVEWRKVTGRSIDEYAVAGRPTPGSLTGEMVVDLQRAYEALKDERRQFDFEDVLLACAGMLEQEPRMALQVREQYRFFVVDEYQDVSPAQQRLLELWVGDRRDVCVVGDASQTIYSFAGASSSHLLDFERAHDGALVVRLEHNYRSSRSVVDTANRLMRGRPGALSLTPAPESAEDLPGEFDAGLPVLATHRDDASEASATADAIAALIRSGTPASDIAVLYRVNVQAAAIERALADRGIGSHVRGATRFFDLPEVKQAVLALRGASVAVTGEPLFKSVSDVLRSLGWTHVPPEQRGAVRDRWESLNAIMGLLDESPPDTTLRQFTDELLERQSAQHEPTLDAVTLATLHASKGLEWDTVFLIGLTEGLVPISYAKTFEAIDEERRLLYVGVTRARRRLRVSWSAYGARSTMPREPSRFLAEIGIRTPDERGSGARRATGRR